jgi:hypothetical protein
MYKSFQSKKKKAKKRIDEFLKKENDALFQGAINEKTTPVWSGQIYDFDLQ